MIFSSPSADRSSRRWAGLAILALGLFMASLDNTILNVAVPTLARELQASTDQLQWTIDSYQVSYAGTLLIAGALVDRWGKRRSFIAGTFIFGLFSLAAGLSPTTHLLIWSRALMGIGAALLAPSTLAMVSDLFTDPRERTQAFALWSLANGAGGAAGPVLAGILLEHFMWGSVFFINLPIAAIIIVFALLVLPAGRGENRHHSIDLVGVILSTIALAVLCWAVISAPGLGITSLPIVTSLIAAGVLLGLFFFWESGQSDPILQLALFSDRRFVVAVLSGGIVTAAGGGALFILSQYLQFILNYSPLATGLRVLPAAAAMLAGALSASRIIQRWGLKYSVIAGLISTVFGFGWLSCVTTQSNYQTILPGIIFFGLGAGILVPAATQAVMDAVPARYSGVGSATNTAIMQVGSALGVAVSGSILSARYRSVFGEDIVHQLSADQRSAALNSVTGARRISEKLPQDLADLINSHASTGFVAGMRTAMAICAATIIVATIIVIIFYPSRREHCDKTK